MIVAIPRFGEEVAPCFEYSATITIFHVVKGEVLNQTDFTLQSQHPFDRFRLLRDQGVETLICGGLEEKFEDLVSAHGIQVISWVSGSVQDLLEQFIRGTLKSQTGGSCSMVARNKLKQ